MKSKHNISFYYLNIMIILMILLPKSLAILEKLPIRVGMILLYIFLVFYEHKKKKIEFNKLNIKFLCLISILFLLATIPSFWITKSILTSLYTIIKFISFILLFITILKVKFTPEEIKVIKKTFLIAISINIIAAILSYIFDINLFKLSNYMYPGIKGRVRSTFFNSCYYATWVIMLIPLMINEYCQNNKKSIIYVIITILLFVCLLLTFTRSAFLIILIILLMMLILFRKKIFNYKSLIVLASVAIIFSIIPGSSNFINKTFRDSKLFVNNIVSFIPGIEIENKDPEEFEDASLKHRQDLANISKQIGKDHPFTGIGFGSYLKYVDSSDFEKDYPKYHSIKSIPHSSLNLLYAETGSISTLLFFIFIVTIIFKVVNIMIYNWKEKNEPYYLSSLAFVICFGFFAIGVMSENLMYDTQIFPLFLIIIGLLINQSSESLINNKRVLFISSTGGHLDELLQLDDIIQKNNSYLITEKTKSNLNLKNKYKHVNYLVFGTKDHPFTYIFKFLYNIIKSLILYLRIRPKIIITTGTHTAVPMCYIGKLFGSKVVFIETFANSTTKTLSGKLVYPISDLFIVQWENMLKLYPKAIYGGWIY